ncbi:MAG: glycosyltransferase family 39 protein [Verrucomicrobiota bacterium]
MPRNKSWLATHPRIVIGLILVVCMGPFSNKAIHVDDALFVWAGEWIQHHPTDFFGSKVIVWTSTIPMWKANCNPPLMSYFLAGVATLFGWNENVLHLACLAVAFAAAVSLYSLARLWCGRPLLATLIGILTPVFLVSSTTLMCDVLMLAFWMWALVVWERALGSEQSRWQFVGAGVLAGLAVLTKYSALTLLPLLPLLSLLRTRKLGVWWLVGLAVPMLMVAGYEWLTARMYGRGLLFAAAHFAQTHRIGFSGSWLAKGIIGLAFAGGSLLPLMFFAPWLWRRRTLLAMGVIIFGALLVVFRLCGNLGLIHPWAYPELMNHWDFLLQVILLTAGGVLLVLLVASEAWQRRDIITVVLVFWILSGLFFAVVLNWTISARSYLPMVPAVVILLVRRLGRQPPLIGDVWLLGPLIPAAVITLSVAVADYRLANSDRTAAEQIAAKYKPADHQLWFEGGFSTFQYYMEKLGGKRMDVEQSILQPGDVVVIPELNDAFFPLPPGRVGWVGRLEYYPRSWVKLMMSDEHSAAGFYSADWGPVPFAVGGLPGQFYFVVKVFSRVQFTSQPVNPQEVQAGDVPSFPHITFKADNKTTFPMKSEVAMHLQLAGQLEGEGKIEAAIQTYRQALAVDSNNPVVLNNLAWILTAANKPELRDGQEAVRLATKAVELTDHTEPIMIGTLAAAYAETGQFTNAVELANNAFALASITGQKDVAAKIAKLRSLYEAGMTPSTAPAP